MLSDPKAPASTPLAAPDTARILVGGHVGTDGGAHMVQRIGQPCCLIPDASARDWAAAAINRDVAVLVVDAAHGLTADLQRQAVLAHLFGVGHTILAIDTPDGDAATAQRVGDIADAAAAFASRAGLTALTCLPVAALPAHLDGLALPVTRPTPPPAQITDQLGAHLLWTSAEPMLPHRRYLLRIGGNTVPATITLLKDRVNPESGEQQAASRLTTGEIGFCNLSLDQTVTYETFADNREAGHFALIDPFSDTEAGTGLIAFGLRRATNLSWQHLDIDKQARAALKGQRSCVIWLTGLSGSGKSTVANLVERKLHVAGRHTYLLDGDNVRHGLNKDLGFTDADRVENIRRIAEVAKLFVDAGVIVLTAFISPFRAERRVARDLLEDGEFVEVFVDAPLTECERRDPKGLYKKARAGLVKHFTGLDSPYEPPERAELVLQTAELTAEQAADRIIAVLEERGFV